jgi:transcriptional regulator with XRE-family HTH domain
VIESPPARRRLIGAALRHYREDNGYDLSEAARILACHRSKVSRIESGERGIRPKQMYELLKEYGVRYADQQALTAIALAQAWGDPVDEDLPDVYREYLELEQAAAEVTVYDPLQLPDLVLNHARLRPLPYGSRTALALISETALRGPNRADIDLLLSLSSAAPWLTLRIVPAMHATEISASATLLRFSDASPLGAIYLPGPSGGLMLVSHDEVLIYRRAFDALKAAALSIPASRSFLNEAIRAAS